MPLGHSRRAKIRWNGDDTFGFYEQASESAILNGELFRENERLFLKQNLRLSSVSFPIGGENTVEIEVKAFWQPEAIHFKGTGSRPGRFVTLLSDIQHPIRDVWAWIKLVRPLYKKGFSVVMLDMPGSGGSAANAELTVDYSVWEAEDWRIVEAAMRSLHVSRTHLVAFGKSARVILKFAKHTKIDHYSSFLARENCWYQPDIDLYAMFHDSVGDCPPGGGQAWHAQAQKRHAHLLREALKGVRILAFFNQEENPPSTVTATDASISVALANEASLAEYYNHQITRADICAVRAHATLPVHLLAMAKNLMETLASFLRGPPDFDPESMKVIQRPNYVPHHLQEADREDDLSLCNVGCVNGAMGLHHWNCPNHPNYKAQVEYKSALVAGAEALVPFEDRWAAEALKHRRPASAPQRARLPGSFNLALALERSLHDSPIAKDKFPVASQANLRGSARFAVQLKPAATVEQQHEEATLKLPAPLRRATLVAKEECDVREAAILEAKARENEVPVVKFDSEEESDFLMMPPLREIKKPEKAVSRTTSKLSRSSRRGASKLSRSASKVSQTQSQVSSPELCVDELMSETSPRARQSAAVKPARSTVVRSESKLSVSFQREKELEAEDADALEMLPMMTALTEIPPSVPAPSAETRLSEKVPTPEPRLTEIPPSVPTPTERRAESPAPVPATAQSRLSRPSSASRLTSFLSSKLSRISRPTSAVLRRSSSSGSLVPAIGQRPESPASPKSRSNMGNLGSWFSDRRHLLTK